MALSQNTYVYMETMETCANQIPKSQGNGSSYWFTTHTVAINMAMTKERLIKSGFYDLATAYQSVHVNY